MKIIVSYNEDTRLWEVEKDFKFHFQGKRHTIPKGFKTDLASVPRIFWSVFPPFGRYAEPAVIHDWACENFDRPTANRVFLCKMLENQNNLFVSLVFYLVV